MDSFLIELMVMAFTFYLLHTVSRFTYVLMIWTIVLVFNWTDGYGFYLLPFTSSKSLHIHINNMNILTLCRLNQWSELLPFTFSKSLHIRINDMSIWILYNSSTGRGSYLLPFTSSKSLHICTNDLNNFTYF